MFNSYWFHKSGMTRHFLKSKIAFFWFYDTYFWSADVYFWSYDAYFWSADAYFWFYDAYFWSYDQKHCLINDVP